MLCFFVVSFDVVPTRTFDVLPSFKYESRILAPFSDWDFFSPLSPDDSFFTPLLTLPDTWEKHTEAGI